MNKYARYYKAVSYIENVGLKAHQSKRNARVKPEIYFKRLKNFLNLLENPERGFKYVHITGTAGKGTVSTMVSSVLTVSGKKNGLLVSPFVVSTIEKIQVNGKYIGHKEFIRIVDKIKPIIEKMRLNGDGPSYFEIIFIIALLYFKKEKCEFVVLEAGCGGRLDYTNIIENPLITAITNIDYDHQKVLGNTLEKIAEEKAGIIKNGSIFWTSETRHGILNIFKKACNKYGAKFNKISEASDYFQANSLLARSISESLGVKEKFIKKGIKSCRLPARFEILQNSPVVIVDCAHNPLKIQSAIDNLKKVKYDNLYVILAFSDGVNLEKMIRKIVPLAKEIVLTQFEVMGRKSMSSETLGNLVKKYTKPNQKVVNISTAAMAFEYVLKEAGAKDVILAAGSFFLAGEIRKIYYREEYILDRRESF